MYCTTVKDHEVKDPPPGKLSVIDRELEQFAKNHNTRVISPLITYDPKVEDSLENRMVEWIEGNIGKAVLIQPHTDHKGAKRHAWDVSNIAWIIDAPSFQKPFWQRFLLENAGIDTLKKNIDQLLSQSEQNLRSIKKEDLK